MEVFTLQNQKQFKFAVYLTDAEASQFLAAVTRQYATLPKDQMSPAARTFLLTSERQLHMTGVSLPD
jgi:hypothetical protein